MTTRQPHVFYVIRSLDIGGTERHLVALAHRLVQRGWKVSVYSLGEDGPLRGQLEQGRVDVILPPGAAGGRTRAKRLTRLARTALHLLSALRRQRPGIVHFLLPATYLFGAPLAIIAGVPIRVMTRQSLNLYQQNVPGTRIVERFLHRRMHAILAVSCRVLRQLRDEEGAPESRLGLIYNGIAAEAFAPAQRDATRARLDLGPAQLVMVMVANLIPYKGHGDLLQALAVVRSDLPDDWRLLIVGRDDGSGDRLRAQSRHLALDDHVRFLGQRDDVAALLDASDIGILSSHQEGFSIAVLEGMAAGLAMIVTDVGGNAEAVIDGASGLVVPPRDPASLGRAVRSLSKDPALRARLGSAARQRVRAEFSIDECVRRHERLYRAMLISSGMPVGQILADTTIGPAPIGLAN